MKEGWRHVKLGDLFQFKNGINFNKNEKGNEGVLTVDVLNMYSNHLDVSLDNLYRVNKNFSSDYFLQQGDILFVRSSVKREGVGWPTFFSGFSEPVTFCGFIIRARPLKTDTVDSKFLIYLLRDNRLREQVVRNAKQSTITNVSQEILSQLSIFLPLLPEQKQIVAILDEAFEGIDRAIANTEKNLANSRELFESHLNTIFTRENSRWKWVNLSEITTDITDGDHQPPPKSQSGIPFITISNIDKQNRKVDFSNTFKVPSEYFEKLKSNRKPRKGDLLYTVTGSYGIPVVVEHDMDFCFQRHIGLIRPSNETNSKCLYYIFLSRYLLNQADECATGTAQKTVSLSGLRRFSVPKIPREEQEAIVVELDLLAEKIYRLEAIYHQKLAALNELKQSILQKAFTGELTVRLSSPTTADTPKTVKEEIAA